MLLKVQRSKNSMLSRLPVILKDLEGKVGKVGWFEEQRYDDKNSTPVAYVATIQEYGYPPKNIPARPFMRPTIIEKQHEWKKIAEAGSRQVIQGKQTVGNVMEAIGLKASGDIKKAISKVTEPPLKPATIAARLAKRSNQSTLGLLTKPLIDTGYMLNSLTNVVEDA
jgi:hypothetical protein